MGQVACHSRFMCIRYVLNQYTSHTLMIVMEYDAHIYPQPAFTPADARRLHAHKHAPHELTVRLARDQRAVRACPGCRASARMRASRRSAAGAPGEGRRALQACGRARREVRVAARAARLPEPEGGREERLVQQGQAAGSTTNCRAAPSMRPNHCRPRQRKGRLQPRVRPKAL